MKQTTLAPKPKRITNKKIIRSDNLTFYPSNARTFEDIVDELETVHHRKSYYVLASGGKDSTYVVDKMANLEKLKSVVHIKTNVGLKITTDHLKDYCQDMGWPLRIIEPSSPLIYTSFVLQYGFPGPPIHKMIMGVLKHKTMRDFALSVDRRDHVLISGVRKSESKRRMGIYKHPIQSDGALWFGCPAFYSKAKDIYKYVITENLKLSPAYALGFGVSGECLCGSYAARGDKMLIRKVDPRLADYFAWLEEGVQKFGTPHAKRYPRWGEGPAMSDLEQQKIMDEFFVNNPELKIASEIEDFVCGQECGPGTMRGMVDY